MILSQLALLLKQLIGLVRLRTSRKQRSMALSQAVIVRSVDCPNHILHKAAACDRAVFDRQK